MKRSQGVFTNPGAQRSGSRPFGTPNSTLVCLGLSEVDGLLLGAAVPMYPGQRLRGRVSPGSGVPAPSESFRQASFVRQRGGPRSPSWTLREPLQRPEGEL